MLERDASSPRPKRRVPAWMRDRATLETIQRQRLLDAGIVPLSPGTKRLRDVLDQAFKDLEQRLADEHDAASDIPF